MKHLQTLDSYLDECGFLSRVIDALDRFAPQVKKDAGELFDEFSKYRMVRNTVTSRSGQVCHKKMQVELHAELLVAGREEQRDQTLLHETAHVIVGLLFPESRFKYSRVKSHGREWKAVMRQLGRKPDRCSNHDFLHEAAAKKAKLMYACQRCEHEFPAMRRKKHSPSVYKHKGCGGGLYLKSERGRTYPNPSKAAA
ncbi:MAG: SprT-like domain-containing protein [Nitrososphaerales archaeon]